MENPFIDKPTQPEDAPTTWTDLCAVSDLPSENGHYVELENRSFAILRVTPVVGMPDSDPPDAETPDGETPGQSPSDEAIAKQLRVMDDRCPHAGASLSAGHIEEGCIICPWHHWAFDINTGVCPDADVYAVRTYEVRILDGRVEARV